jgi:hypothetical protein
MMHHMIFCETVADFGEFEWTPDFTDVIRTSSCGDLQ